MNSFGRRLVAAARHGLNATLNLWHRRDIERKPSSMVMSSLLRNEDKLIQIPADAAVFREASLSPEHPGNRPGNTGGDGSWSLKRKVGVAVLLLGLAAWAGYGAILAITEALAGEASHFLRDVGIVLLVTLLAGGLWRVYSLQRAREISDVRRGLGVDGGQDRRRAVRTWLTQHWNWPLPPKLFDGVMTDFQGVWQGHRFLLVAQWEYRESYTPLETHMNRTCVFIAGHAPSAKRLPPLEGFPFTHAIHVVVTPAGLFAYWAGATMAGADTIRGVLDRLVELADAAGISTESSHATAE